MWYRTTDLASLLFAQLSAAAAERDRMFEPVIGLVTDNRDPDRLGRVKVRIPVLGTDDAGWAQVVVLGGGRDRGWFFLPEVDDEVLVLFEHGDVRRPVVVGQLWNGQDEPPDDVGARAIVSRAGSVIRFDDDGGVLRIEDGGGFGVITLDATHNAITIEAPRGDVCLQAPSGDLTVVAGSLEVTGQLNVHVESLGGIDIGGDAAITVKGQGLLQVHGPTIDIQPGGVRAPAAASATVAEVPDPLTATGDGEAGSGTARRDAAEGDADGGGPGDGGERDDGDRERGDGERADAPGDGGGRAEPVAEPRTAP